MKRQFLILIAILSIAIFGGYRAAADSVTLSPPIPYASNVSWTPTLAFGGASVGITYSGTRVGVATKVGTMVVASFNFTLTNKGSSVGAATVSGLPYSPVSASIGCYSAFENGFSVGTTFPITGNVDPSTTTIGLYNGMVGGIVSGMTDANFTNTSDLRLTCVYSTAN